MKVNNALFFNIAVIGQKRIGKNFFSEMLSKSIESKGMLPLSEISIASSIKYQSIFPQGFDEDNFHYDYLYEDIMKLYNQGALLDVMEHTGLDYSFLINDIKGGKFAPHYLRQYYSKDYILALIEAFKVEEPFLSTRRHLQEFGDYLKEKSNNPFILSEALLVELKEKDFYHDICTDTRFITELIDFILNDFYIIQLKNAEMEISDSTELLNQHSSELELGLYKGDIGHVFDLQTDDGLYIQGAHRLSQEEMFDMINDNLGRILSFQGYKLETKQAIKELKKQLIAEYNSENDGLLLAQAEFSSFQKGVLASKQNMSDYYEEGLLLLGRYLSYRDSVVSYICEIISPYYH